MGTTNVIMLSLCICGKYKEEPSAQVQHKKNPTDKYGFFFFPPDLMLVPMYTSDVLEHFIFSGNLLRVTVV